MEQLRRRGSWLKKTWEAWHQIDAARALFQLIREWLWVVFAAIRWGGALLGLIIALALFSFGWISDYWYVVFTTGALFAVAISNIVTLRLSRSPSSPSPMDTGVREGAGETTVTEPVYVPEDLPEDTARFVQVTPRVSRGHLRGRTRVFLELRNPEGKPIKGCYGRLSCVIWAMHYVHNDEGKVSHRRQFADLDIFLEWHSVTERYHSFHTEAILDVARAGYGDGQGGWAAHPETPASRSISFHEDYYITVEIAAEDETSQRMHYRLRIYTESRRIGTHIYLEHRGTPPHAIFEEISEADMPEADNEDELYEEG